MRDLFLNEPCPPELPAISLWQPWASLIFTGRKRHETRDWRLPRSYDRGCKVILHAAKTRSGYRDTHDALDRICREEFGVSYDAALPLGCALGFVWLDGCLATNGRETAATDDDFECGNFMPGRFAWRITKFEAFATPVQMRGRQGFWFVPEREVAP